MCIDKTKGDSKSKEQFNNNDVLNFAKRSMNKEFHKDRNVEKKYGYRLMRPQIPFRMGGSIGKKRIIYPKSIL